ncbi:MAG: hypothetical protein ACE5IC_05595 [Candidatus Brocadiales bacterium]
MLLLIVIGLSSGATPSALALRPFVTTDADVAEPFEAELEIGVAGFTMEKEPGPDEVRIQSPPSIRFNLGFPGDWELVLETIHEFIDKENRGGFESDINQFTETAGFIKKVWYRGEDWVPNVATETGLLFPTERGAEKARGADFEGTIIFSWFLPSFTWHMTMGGATHHTGKDELGETRAQYIFGTILDVPVPSREHFHLVGEYSGEKVEKEELEHQLLGGMVWHSPWEMDFDMAGFGGLSTESVDWGVTVGVTISTQLIRRRRWEAKP